MILDLARPRWPGALLVLLAALGCAGWGAPVRAQQPDTAGLARPAPPQERVEPPEVEGPASPGGAFARAVVLPGWGHAAIGEHTRGAFYFAAEGSALWMLVRTIRRRGTSREAVAFREGVVEDRLRAQGVEDPQTIEEALDADEDVSDARLLLRARDQQFQDWLALSIFLAFLSGADAFVSAHLQDFPEPVQVGLRPVGERRWEIGLSVRIPPIR